jgi:hypothetical protein
MAQERVGTLPWIRTTAGRLRPRDYPSVLADAAVSIGLELPQLILGRLGFLPHDRGRLDPVHFQPPDRCLATLEAEQVCDQLRPTFLTNHSYRTYVWASLLAAREGIVFDAPILYLACLLHDVGLSETHQPPTRPFCFTLMGAEYARRISESAHWEEDRRRRVEEAITLHMNPRVRRHEGAEAHLLARGSQLDAVGFGYWGLEPDLVAKVLNRYPRRSVKAGFVERFDSALHHPASRARLYRRLGSRWLFRFAPFDE